MGGNRFAVVVRVMRTRTLRRLETAYFLFSFAENATWLATIVYAFGRGGVDEVGVAAVVLMVPAVLVAPFAAYAGDRFRADRALAAGHLVQALAMIVTWAGMQLDHPIGAYVGAAAVAASVTFTRPVMGSLLPAVTHTPADLVAANVASKLVEQVGSLLGPVAAGVIVASASSAEVFLSCGLGLLVAAGLVASTDRDGAVFTAGERPGPGAVVSEVLGGFSVLRRLPVVRSLVVLTSIGGLVIGVCDVLAVVFVEARLGGGGDRSGMLAGALGLGSTIGAVAASGLFGRGRTFRFLAVSCVLVAVPFVGLAVAGSLPSALGIYLVLGLGETLLAVTASVLIQRHGAPGTLARVFGIAEGLQMGSIALGSFAVSALAARVSLRASLVVIAFGLGGLAALALWRVRRGAGEEIPLDDSIVERLLADPVLESLPAPSIERLARGAERREAAAGSTLIVQGDIGTDYFLVVSGHVEVTVDGQLIRTISAGSSFGEIALVRDVPRTATVTAIDDVVVLAVGRDDFLEAVTGHPRSFGVASSVADRLLAPSGGSDGIDDAHRPGDHLD